MLIFLRRRLFLAALVFTLLAGQQGMFPARASAAGYTNPVYAGVELPTMGIVYWQQGLTWDYTAANYFSPAVMSDIKNNLGATYIRTGWVPNWVYNNETVPWQREDVTMDAACAAGLGVMVIVPPPSYDARGIPDEIANIQAFFSRYTMREPGCRFWAEVENEADLYYSTSAYASYFEQVAPIIRGMHIPTITTGTSGEDIPWTVALSRDLSGYPSAHPDGYGFHPYGIAPQNMQAAEYAVQQSTSADAAPVYVTEIGESDPSSLLSAMEALYRGAQTITIYTYKDDPGAADIYGLVNNAARYNAARGGFGYVTGQNKFYYRGGAVPVMPMRRIRHL